MDASLDLSVLICTWNRAPLLRRCLERLVECPPPPRASYEVIVVDNCCTDSTPALLDEYSRRLPLRAVAENRQGKAHACNAALDAARGRVLLFLDDDALVLPGWSRAYLDAAARTDAGFFGGPIRPHFDGPPPRWLAEGIGEVENAYALLDHGPAERPLIPPETVYGANMGFRADALADLRFDPDRGYRGGLLLLGEETELMERLQAAGRGGLWVPEAGILHILPAARMTLRYLRAYYRGFGLTCALSVPARGARMRLAWMSLLKSCLESYPTYVARRLTGRPATRWLRAYRRAQSGFGKAAGCLLDAPGKRRRAAAPEDGEGPAHAAR